MLGHSVDVLRCESSFAEKPEAGVGDMTNAYRIRNLVRLQPENCAYLANWIDLLHSVSPYLDKSATNHFSVEKNGFCVGMPCATQSVKQNESSQPNLTERARVLQTTVQTTIACLLHKTAG